MFWQRELYRTATPMAFGQTFELDLPRHGNLGSIGLVFSSAGVAGAFATIEFWRLIDYITRIELIGDGAEVIKSFDGRQALACNYYDDHVVPFSLWRNYLAAPHRQGVVINLGRHVHDLTHWLDMGRFSQVKLRITNNATAALYTTAINLDVTCHWLREPKTASVGYYREEEWKLWNPAAAAIEYTELPTALKIRRILLRPRPAVDTADADNNSSQDALMRTIDFSLQTGQTRVYQGSLDNLARLSAEELGFQPETYGNICRTAAFKFDVGLGYVCNLTSAPASMGALPAAYPLTLAQGDVNDGSQGSIGYQADYPLHWQARGLSYMYNTPLFDSDDPEDADILDPETSKVVKLDIGCAAGTTVAGTNHVAQNAIILSRLVP
jgi:hypothetical protein